MGCLWAMLAGQARESAGGGRDKRLGSGWGRGVVVHFAGGQGEAVQSGRIGLGNAADAARLILCSGDVARGDGDGAEQDGGTFFGKDTGKNGVGDEGEGDLDGLAIFKRRELEVELRRLGRDGADIPVAGEKALMEEAPVFAPDCGRSAA